METESNMKRPSKVLREYTYYFPQNTARKVNGKESYHTPLIKGII